MKNTFFILIIIFLFQNCYKESSLYEFKPTEDFEITSLLKFNGKECFFDKRTNSFRFPISAEEITNFNPQVSFSDDSKVYFEDFEIENNALNNFGTIKTNKDYKITFSHLGEERDFTFNFTTNNLVRIISPFNINDEPKTLAKIEIIYADETLVPSEIFIGIEYRGASSLRYDKKSYGLSILKDKSLNDTKPISLFGLNETDEWIIDAMFIDQAKMRNKISFDLWKQVRGNNFKGIQLNFVELYINQKHYGLYCFGENVNGNLLNINNNDALYKSILKTSLTDFESYDASPPNDFYWDGWEQKIPKNKLNLEPLRSFQEFIVTSDEQTFKDDIGNEININNFIDYYLFVNIILGYDNISKNNFYLKKNNQKIEIFPWDLDATWGRTHNANTTETFTIATNSLFDKLYNANPNNYKTKVKQRWFDLRNDVYSSQNLHDLFSSNFQELNKTNIIDIENQRWETGLNLQEEEAYIHNWIDQRLVFLDDYFTNHF